MRQKGFSLNFLLQGLRGLLAPVVGWQTNVGLCSWAYFLLFLASPLASEAFAARVGRARASLILWAQTVWGNLAQQYTVDSTPARSCWASAGSGRCPALTLTLGSPRPRPHLVCMRLVGPRVGGGHPPGSSSHKTSQVEETEQSWGARFH